MLENIYIRDLYHNAGAKMDLEKVVDEFGSSNRLEVDVPTSLVIQIDGVEGYLKTKLVGMEPENFLIIASPRANLTVRDRLTSGNSVVISYLHRGSLFSFQSHVLNVIDTPYKLIFISYPKIISRKELRKTERVDCYLTGLAKIKDKELKGIIVDISNNGCRLVIRKDGTGARKINADPGDNLLLSISGGAEDGSIDFSCVVRNKKDDTQMISLGLEFAEMQEEQKGFVSDIINELGALAEFKED
jgi:c-di-GMP-binding flagellar brake protein YcgR